MILYGIERYFIELLRGDPGRGEVFGGVMSGNPADFDLSGARRRTDLVVQERRAGRNRRSAVSNQHCALCIQPVPTIGIASSNLQSFGSLSDAQSHKYRRSQFHPAFGGFVGPL